MAIAPPDPGLHTTSIKRGNLRQPTRIDEVQILNVVRAHYSPLMTDAQVTEDMTQRLQDICRRSNLALPDDVLAVWHTTALRIFHQHRDEFYQPRSGAN